MKTTGREDDFVAKMYFTDDIDGGIELDWCFRWKREILGWNDEMATGQVGLYGGGRGGGRGGEESFASFWNRDRIRMRSLIFCLRLFYSP